MSRPDRGGAYPSPDIHASVRDEHGLGVLDRDTCMHLLATQPVGRLGFSARSLPVIMPVNYVLHDESILFRSEPGHKLKAAEQNAVACFEIDEFDPFSHTGWSVVATGRMERRDADHAAAETAHLQPWGLSDAWDLVSLSVELLSGRLILPR